MENTEEKTSTSWGWAAILGWIVYILVWLLYSVGASRLAYIRTSSGVMAVLAFILSPIYYVYYAFTQPAVLSGAGRAAKYIW